MDALQKTKKKIDELMKAKREQLDDLQARRAAAEELLRAALDDCEKAARENDEAAFKDAQSRENMARTQLRLWGEKYDEVSGAEMISEAESDTVLVALLEYEKELAAKYTGAIVDPLLALYRTLKEYQGLYEEAEGVMQRWTANIHANYRSTTGLYYDTETGEYKSRSPKPVPLKPPQKWLCEVAALVFYFYQNELVRDRELWEALNNKTDDNELNYYFGIKS